MLMPKLNEIALRLVNPSRLLTYLSLSKSSLPLTRNNDMQNALLWLQNFHQNPLFPELHHLVIRVLTTFPAKLPSPMPSSSNYYLRSKNKESPKRSLENEMIFLSMTEKRWTTSTTTASPSSSKRRRGSALRAENVPPSLKPFWMQEAPCKNCGTENSIIEDVQEGHVVCTQCGIIQHSGILETALTNAQYHGGISRTVVHHYSRWIYLHSIIQATTGSTTVEIEPKDLNLIRQFSQERGECTPKSVQLAIRKLKLPKRLMRHATTLAHQLWPQKYRKVVEVGSSERAVVCRRFREYENAWQSARSAKFREKRKSFVNYRLLWERLIEDLALGHLSLFPEGMKNKTLDKNQRTMILELKTFI
jgi:hypothetical protein